MSRHKLTIGAVAAAFALSLAPVSADQGGRPNNTGSSSGSAESRGGGSSGGSSSGSSSSGSSSAGSASSGSSGESSVGSSNRGSARAPEHPSSSERRGGDRAAPRSSGSNGSANTRAGGSSSSIGSDEQGARDRAVPSYSRPRDGRNPVGTATERRGGIPGRDVNIHPGYYYDPFYFGFGYSPFYSSSRYGYGYSPYGFPGYGFGLGYFGYDPFSYGGGYGGYDPYSQGGYGSYSSGGYRDTGSLRLKVKPGNAQVYVDGYYVGVVDSFDGAFQRLGIEAGSHRIEIRAEGFQPVQFEVMVTPGETITYKGELKRIE